MPDRGGVGRLDFAVRGNTCCRIGSEKSLDLVEEVANLGCGGYEKIGRCHRRPIVFFPRNSDLVASRAVVVPVDVHNVGGRGNCRLAVGGVCDTSGNPDHVTA